MIEIETPHEMTGLAVTDFVLFGNDGKPTKLNYAVEGPISGEWPT